MYGLCTGTGTSKTCICRVAMAAAMHIHEGYIDPTRIVSFGCRPRPLGSCL